MGIVLICGGAASAATVLDFDFVGDSGALTFNGFNDFGTIDGLSSSITFTLTGIDTATDVWTFDYSLANTSGSPVTASRVSTFGFNVDPDVAFTGAVESGAVFDGVSSGNIPNGLPNVEFCLTAGPNCSGGGGQGVLLGGSTSGSFSLDFAGDVSTVSFADLYVRYQSINAPGISGGSAVGVGTVVPEPATWAMMIFGFGGVGGLMRRRRMVFA